MFDCPYSEFLEEYFSRRVLIIEFRFLDCKMSNDTEIAFCFD